MKKIDQIRLKMMGLCLLIIFVNSLSSSMKNYPRLEAIAPDTKPIKIVRVSQK